MPTMETATDSATTLRECAGDDATATFEHDPNFVESNPTGNASTENIEVQRDSDDVEDSEEEIEEAEEEEDDDEDDVEEGVDEDALDEDDMDTDKVTSGWPAASL